MQGRPAAGPRCARQCVQPCIFAIFDISLPPIYRSLKVLASHRTYALSSIREVLHGAKDRGSAATHFSWPVAGNAQRRRLQSAVECMGHSDPASSSRHGTRSCRDRRHRESVGRPDATGTTRLRDIARYMSASRSPKFFTSTFQSVTAMIETTDLQQLVTRLKNESEAAKALMIEYGLMPFKKRNSTRNARLPVRHSARRDTRQTTSHETTHAPVRRVAPHAII
jgi:hypothetical protein